MSQPDWQHLVATLRDETNPKARRRAVEQLAATRDPAVIPFLRNVYYQDDDDRVHRAAEKALAQFGAQREHGRARSAAALQRALNGLVGVLVIALVVTLALNAITRIRAGDEDSDFRNQTPTQRDVLLAKIQSQYDAARQLDADLRGEIAHYNDSGQPACPLDYSVPPPLALKAIDDYTYPDLKIVAANLDVTLPSLQAAIVLFNSACTDPNLQTRRILDAARKLDTVESQLKEVASLLLQAGTQPAATVGPSPTLRPTWTHTPQPTRTPVPLTATQPATATPTLGPSATATLAGTATRAASATPSRTPSPSPTATLPRPDLDYSSILRQLSRRFIVLGDLQNSYGTGMIDQWQRALDEGQTSSGFCGLSDWPEPYALTDAERAAMAGGLVADPQLTEAIRLQQEGLALAVQARALYERDCPALALATSAREGTALAQNAFDKLTQAQVLTDVIRAAIG